jgi:hypothetical protein
MNLFERVKKILSTPKIEWLVIATESTPVMTLLVNYVLPLTIVYSLGSFLTGMFWSSSFGGFQYAVISAIINILTAIATFFIASYSVDMLAPSFDSEKNLDKSAQLVAYSNTAIWIAGLFSFIPLIGLLITIAGAIYTIYLMYLGIGAIKKTPEDKKVVYMIVVFVIMLIVGGIMSYILRMVFFRSMGYGALGGFGY